MLSQMRFITIFLSTLFLLLPSPGFPEYPRADTVKAIVGNIREKPSTDSRAIEKVYQGDTVTIQRLEGNWLYVKLTDGTQGWAHRILFDIPTPSPPLKTDGRNNNPALSATITEFGANVRAAPSRKAKIVDYLRRGDTVRILDKTGNWHRVEYEGKKTGWMHKSLFSPPQKEAVTENKKVKEIKSIQTVVYSEMEEKVLFTLSGYFPPKTSTISGDNPKVVCDFAGVQPIAGIPDEITADGKFTRKIKIDANDKGTKIFVILSPDYDYHIEQVFFKEEKVYSLIFRKM
jgi:SH3-like domain-containing protein